MSTSLFSIFSRAQICFPLPLRRTWMAGSLSTASRYEEKQTEQKKLLSPAVIHVGLESKSEHEQYILCNISLPSTLQTTLRFSSITKCFSFLLHKLLYIRSPRWRCSSGRRQLRYFKTLKLLIAAICIKIRRPSGHRNSNQILRHRRDAYSLVISFLSSIPEVTIISDVHHV